MHVSVIVPELSETVFRDWNIACSCSLVMNADQGFFVFGGDGDFQEVDGQPSAVAISEIVII
jgi:hypothetical protein